MKEIIDQINAIKASLQVIVTLVESEEKKRKNIETKYLKIIAELKKQAGNK